MVINNKPHKQVNAYMKLRITSFVNFIRRPEFSATRKRDISETEPETLYFLVI
jgi:hypothetical protein